jgi:uncharacterized membrane protein
MMFCSKVIRKKDTMRKIFLILICLISLAAFNGCMDIENTSTHDANTYGQVSNPFFAQAKEVFRVNCTPCHSYQGLSEAQLIDTGLIIPGNAENSQLYYRLRNSAGSNGPKNMPTWGSLTTSDIQLIRDWIDSL